jgi:uncharacterized ferritin-like protein (DUF455 family)
MELRAAARDVLVTADPAIKLDLLQILANRADDLVVDSNASMASPELPGRPARPVLVHPARVPRRRFGTPAGRMALVHALAHIEFNAINLALDAAVRFSGLPAAYYRDWLHVACEEAHHFKLLIAHLASQGSYYGEFPAHDGLWEAAFKTRDDVLARMALVPRILEARGLDVTPGIQDRLRAVGDVALVEILDVVLRDEIGHVAIGNHWYDSLCAARGLDPALTFRRLCADYAVKLPHPPFNIPARCAAGFEMSELTALTALAEVAITAKT